MKKKPWFITASILACVSSPIIMTYLQEGRSGEDALLVAFAWPLILLATLIVGLLLAFVAILRGEKPSRLAWGICFLNIPLTYYLLSETLYWRKDSIVPEIFLFGSIIILLSLKKWRALSKGIAVQRALNKWCATNNLEFAVGRSCLYQATRPMKSAVSRYESPKKALLLLPPI